MKAQWQNPRGIKERIIVQGTLILDTPTHLGNGDADGPLDMPLLLDPLDNRALLTGTSIAGALRNYLREYSGDLAEELFGNVSEEESIQSPLVVDDALGGNPEVELRDGVAISPSTRTAEPEKKFDTELLCAGTKFHLFFELQVLENKRDKLRKALAIALKGLENCEIRLGKRKRRGFGKCHVRNWVVCRFDMTDPKGLIAWLDNDHTSQHEGKDIASLLDTEVPELDPNRGHVCILECTFAIDGSLLIRSGFGKSYVFNWNEVPGKDTEILRKFLTDGYNINWAETAEIEKIDNGKTIKVFAKKESLSLKLSNKGNEVIFEISSDETSKFEAKTEDGKLKIYGKSNAPDCVHLHSKRDDQDVPVISGTSLAGALRARALRISKTLGKDGRKVTDNIFGNRIYEDDQKELTASRLWIDEAIIQHPLDLVHSRVKIDRFTGGAFPSALFSEQPVFGKLTGDTIVKIHLKLMEANNSDVGLLLLLLKDLWTGDLPIGGESSVGRGRLKGKHAIISFDGYSWEFSQGEDKMLQIVGDDKAKLEEFVHEFVEVS